MKQFLRLSKNDPADFEALLQETIAGLETFRQEIRTALSAGNKEAFKNLTDKIKMTLAVLRADKLQKMLSRANDVLKEPDITTEEFELIAGQIDAELENVVAGLKNAG